MASKRKSGHRYTVEAGRQIYCDGEPFVSIGREGHTHPSNADEAVKVIAALLNKAHWSSPYPNDYMRAGNSRPPVRRRSRR